MLEPVARIEALTTKAVRAAWSPRTDIDWWGCAPVVPDTMSRTRYVALVSQLFHVEKAALAMATATRARLGEPAAQAFIATQIDDHDRAAQVYRGYLERLGDVAPVDPGLGAVLSAMRAWDGPAWGAIAAHSVVLEQEHVPALHRMLGPVRCRLLRQIHVRVAADAARHAEFGHLYVDHAASVLTADERRPTADWLRQLRAQWTDAALRFDVATARAPSAQPGPGALFLRLALGGVGNR